MGTMRGGLGMGMHAERSPHGRSARASADLPKKKIDFRKAMPEVWKLVRPRKWLLLLGLVLVAINRVAGLTLPFVSRPFVNLVLGQHQGDRLIPLVIAVFVATFIQAITSFSNTQLLSKAAQRMIAELRQQVQQHVGRLSVSFYDENRTGLLVSRIMSDVEGVRNLIGTGLVEFVGRPAYRGHGICLSHAPQPEDDADRLCRSQRLRVHPAVRLQNHPPHLSRARQNYWRRHGAPDGVPRRCARHQGLPR